jgi:hypothetical protein
MKHEHAMRLSSFLLSVVLGGASSSCFAVTDLDRFQTKQSVTGNFLSLRLSVRGMTSHVNEYFEYRVIDATNTLQSRGIVTPLGGVDATMFAQGAVPRQNGPLHIDFFADHDKSGGYTPPSGAAFPDHAWRLPLPDEGNDQGIIDIQFDHNTSFGNLIDPTPPKEFGKPSTVRLRNLGGLLGKRVEVRVADASVKRVVALYRVPAIDKPEIDAVVPGVIESGVTYAIDVYVDDGKASAGTVQTFRFEADSDANGLTATFDPATSPKAADVPPP